MKQENKVNILILEQNQDLLTHLEHDLVNAGYNVLTAKVANEALNLIANNAIDMIFLDVNMPGQSEDTFIQELKFSPVMASISVIILGATSDENEITTALSLGADEFIEKSYILSVLINRVNNILRLSEGDEYGTADAIPSMPLDKPYESSPNISSEAFDNNTDDEERFPGIDYNTGVHNVLGDDDLFVEILTMFYDDHAEDKDKIKQAIATNDYTTCKSLVHTLKGVAGSIGALELFNTTKALDTAINLEQVNDFQTLFIPVEIELNKIVSGLKDKIIDKN